MRLNENAHRCSTSTFRAHPLGGGRMNGSLYPRPVRRANSQGPRSEVGRGRNEGVRKCDGLWTGDRRVDGVQEIGLGMEARSRPGGTRLADAAVARTFS